MASDPGKICFVISPIGSEGTEIRDRSDQVLRHLIEPAVKLYGYQAIRADAISTPGMITSQVIEHVLESPLVIADLTDHNPNVFYELAVRHIVRKPLIQMIEKPHTLPFDVAGARTIFFELSLDGVADAVEQIGKQIEALERDPLDLDTPISITADLMNLGRTTNQDQSDLSQLLPLLTDINSSMHTYGREIRSLRADLSGIERRQRRNADVEAQANLPEPGTSLRNLDTVLRLVRGIDPQVYAHGRAARGQILVGDSEGASVLLTELIGILETNSDVPPGLRSLAIAEINTTLGLLAGQQREERRIEDAPF